jgi:hypothetical protein
MKASSSSCFLLAIACGGVTDPSEGEPRAPDLPEGWGDAEKVTEFLQFACGGSALEGGNERMDLRGAEHEVLIEYYDAHFRCAQDVEAYSMESGDHLEVLVQPVDMDPDGVAACDCLYEIHLIVDTDEEQEYSVTLYRRWDNLNSDNEPVVVDTRSISAEAPE